MTPALFLAGCGTEVDTTGTYVTAPTSAGTRLPRPKDVLVTDFTLDWHTVQLDQGVRARFQRGNPTADQQAMAEQVRAAITDTLVEQINAMGLHAVHATRGIVPRPGDVTVAGQIVKVNGGNATRRALIGFGAGKSDVEASVALYQGSKLLQTYDADANSGRTPGLGVGAAGAAAGHVAVAAAGTVAGTASRARSGLPLDGEHLARRVAVNLGTFFSQQGWIDASAVPSEFTR